MQIVLQTGPQGLQMSISGGSDLLEAKMILLAALANVERSIARIEQQAHERAQAAQAKESRDDPPGGDRAP